MRILIVDDSEEGRDVAEVMLLAAGYADVNTVSSAADAYDFLAIGESATGELSPVDLILLDIMMPEIDGIAACARIRNEPRYSELPIIMVTSLDDMDHLANALVAGATDYVTKPLNRTELLARVRAALKLKSAFDRRLERDRDLLKFMSTWSDRRALQWIDNTTGLFVGEVVEAYLIATAHLPSDSDTSVIALAVDRLETYRSTLGDAGVANIMARVAHAVRTTVASVGVIAATYRDGVIVLVVPDLPPKPAVELGDALRASVSRLDVPKTAQLAASHVTASVAVVTGRISRSIEGVHLLSRALSAIPRAVAAGGNRVVPEYA